LQKIVANGRADTYTFQDLTFIITRDTFTMSGSLYADDIGAISVQTVSPLVWDTQNEKVTSGHVVANQLVHIEWSNAAVNIWFDRNQNGIKDQDEVVQ